MGHYLKYCEIATPMAVMVELVTASFEIAELPSSAASNNTGSDVDVVSCLLLAFITILVLIALVIHQFLKITKMHRRSQKEHDDKIGDVTQYYALLSAMNEMRRVINYEIGVQCLYDNIVGMLMESFHCHRVTLLIYKRESEELVLCSVSGEANKDILDSRLKVGEGVAGWVALNRQAILLGGADDENKYAGINLDNHAITSAMVVPMIIEDEFIGVIEISMFSSDVTFDCTDLQNFQELAHTAGLCIQYCRYDRWNNHTSLSESPDIRDRENKVKRADSSKTTVS